MLSQEVTLLCIKLLPNCESLLFMKSYILSLKFCKLLLIVQGLGLISLEYDLDIVGLLLEFLLGYDLSIYLLSFLNQGMGKYLPLVEILLEQIFFHQEHSYCFVFLYLSTLVLYCKDIAIGKNLILSPTFPPLHTVRETFTSYGAPSKLI